MAKYEYFSPALEDEALGDNIESKNISVNQENINATLKRIELFLEDENWYYADKYCEAALDADPTNAEVYLMKLLASLNIRSRAELKNVVGAIDGNKNYQYVLRFGDNDLQQFVIGCNENGLDRKYSNIYKEAEKEASQDSIEKQELAIKIFEQIPDYRDSKDRIKACKEKIEYIKNDEVYQKAVDVAKQNTENAYTEAAALLKLIDGFKDSHELIEKYTNQAETIRLEKEKAAEERSKKTRKVLKIAISAICACIAVILVLSKVIIPIANYKSAIKMIDAGNYIKAYEKLVALDGYKDSVDKASEIYTNYCKEKIKNAEVGDVVLFGSYEQDNDKSNGKENIEWLVLEKKGDKALLISDKALDCEPYNKEDEGVTWATCSLRKWLNDDFLNAAFSKEEQKLIKTTEVSADKNPDYSTNPGKATSDKVFLLSIKEAEKYFDSDEERMCIPTEYANAQGVYRYSEYTKDGEGTCYWWLRSPGSYLSIAAYVFGDGDVTSTGYFVYGDEGGVRPALWVNL